MSAEKFINTSYLNPETILDFPVDALIVKRLKQANLTDDTKVSFANVTGGVKAFEAWAYDHHIPGNHVTQRVAKKYLQLYELKHQLHQKKQHADQPMAVKQVSADQPHLVSDGEVSDSIVDQLLKFKLIGDTEIVSYHDARGGVKHFQPWALGNHIPLDIDKQLVQARYLKLYHQLLAQIDAEHEADLKQRQQLLAQSQAASKAAAARQQVLASQAASQAALAKSVKASLIAKSNQNQATSIAPGSSHVESGKHGYDDLLLKKHHLSTDPQVLQSYAKQHLGADNPFTQLLGEVPPTSTPSSEESISSSHASTTPVQSDSVEMDFDDLLDAAEAVPGLSSSHLESSIPAASSTESSAIDFAAAGSPYDMFGDGTTLRSDQIAQRNAQQLAKETVESSSNDQSKDDEDVAGLDLTEKPNPRHKYYPDDDLFTTLPASLDQVYGPYTINRKLKRSKGTRLKVDEHVVNGMRETFQRFFEGQFITEMLQAQHKDRNGNVYVISDTDLLMTYVMYAQTAAGIYSKLTWQQWCAGKVLDQLVANTKNSGPQYKQRPYQLFNQYKSLHQAIYNDNSDPNNSKVLMKLPDRMRWYLYLSIQTPRLTTEKPLSQATINQKLDQVINGMDLSQRINTVLLSLQDENQWEQLLVGERGRKLADMINKLRPDLIKPMQTMRRTDLTRYQNQQRKRD